MSAAPFRSIFAGVVLGSVSIFLTYHLELLFHAGSNVIAQAFKAAGIAMVVPGIIAAMAVGNLHSFRLYLSAAVNFVFWLGFAWLFGICVRKLIVLRRAIAAVKVK